MIIGKIEASLLPIPCKPAANLLRPHGPVAGLLPRCEVLDSLRLGPTRAGVLRYRQICNTLWHENAYGSTT